MHISLYQMLKSMKVSVERSAEVVNSLEEFMAVKIFEANIGLEAQLRAQNWLIGIVGVIIAIIGLAPFIAKLV